MKKLLLSIPIICTMLTLSYGDTVTTGNLKLLQPTTGVRDITGRSGGDKINVDLQIIDSTMTSLMSQINALNATTGQFLINGIGVIFATNTAPGVFLLNGTNVIFSTNVKDGDLNGIDIAAGTVGGTQTVRGILGGVVQNCVGCIDISTQAAVSGVTSGDYTNPNITVNNRGQITAASNGVASNIIRTRRVVLGTSSVQGVDIVSTSHEGFIAAVASLTVIGGGDIDVREGIFTATDTVFIPSNVVVYASRGTIFRNASNGIENVLNIAGHWTGGIFEPTNLRSAGTMFMQVQGPFGKLDNYLLRNSTNTTDTTFAYMFFTGNGAKISNGEITNMNPTGGSCRAISSSGTAKNFIFEGNHIFANTGGCAGLAVFTSTGPLFFRNNTFEGNSWTHDELFIHRSSGGVIAFNHFDMCANNAQAAIHFQTQSSDGTNAYNTIISHNSFICGTDNVTIQTHDSPSYAKNITISNNTFDRPTLEAIKIYRSTTGTALNTFIHGNVIASTGTLTLEDAASVNTLKRDNLSGGVLIGDN